MIHVAYLDADDNDRSKLFNLLRRASAWLPERSMRTLWYRLMSGPNQQIRWGKRIRFEGNGFLRLGPSLEVNDGVWFNLNGTGGVILRTKAFINSNAIIWKLGENGLTIGANSYVGFLQR